MEGEGGEGVIGGGGGGGGRTQHTCKPNSKRHPSSQSDLKSRFLAHRPHQTALTGYVIEGVHLYVPEKKLEMRRPISVLINHI